MTLPYTWNPMPHVVDVSFPKCQARATFEFAEAVRIRKADIDCFKKSRYFDYQLMEGTYSHRNWHAAEFRQPTPDKMHNPRSPIRETPETRSGRRRLSRRRNGSRIREARISGFALLKSPQLPRIQL